MKYFERDIKLKQSINQSINEPLPFVSNIKDYYKFEQSVAQSQFAALPDVVIV